MKTDHFTTLFFALSYLSPAETTTIQASVDKLKAAGDSQEIANLRQQAYYLGKLGKFEDANAVFDSILSNQDYQNVSLILSLRATNFAHLTIYDLALNDINEAIRLKPDSLAYKLINVKILAASENAVAQLELWNIYHEATDEQKCNLQLHALANRLGVNFNKAPVSSEISIDFEFNPPPRAPQGSADAYFLKATAFQNNLELEDQNAIDSKPTNYRALKNLTRALLADPHHAPSLLARAHLSLTQDDISKARHDLEVFFANSTQAASKRFLGDAHYLLARCFLQEFNDAEALIHCDKALVFMEATASNHIANRLFSRGQVLFYLKRYSESKESLTTFLDFMSNLAPKTLKKSSNQHIVALSYALLGGIEIQ